MFIIASCVIAHKRFIWYDMNFSDIISLRLKSLRHSVGWSLDVVSKNTGVSKAMLGQIERGESSPTIATLWKIAAGFNVSFSSFVEDLVDANNTTVYRESSLKQMHKDDDKTKVMTVFPFDEAVGFEIFIIELLPSCEHISPMHQSGVVEHIVVAQGEMDVMVNGKWHSLKQGDGFKFAADVLHGYRNLSGVPAVFHDIIHYS